jgi:hypothetical protein
MQRVFVKGRFSLWENELIFNFRILQKFTNTYFYNFPKEIIKNINTIFIILTYLKIENFLNK